MPNYWLLIESIKKTGDEHVCLHFTELALWTLHILALSYLALSEFAGAVLLTSQCLRRNLVLSVLWEKILADLWRRKPLQSLKDKKWENIFLRSLPGLFWGTRINKKWIGRCVLEMWEHRCQQEAQDAAVYHKGTTSYVRDSETTGRRSVMNRETLAQLNL